MVALAGSSFCFADSRERIRCVQNTPYGNIFRHGNEMELFAIVGAKEGLFFLQGTQGNG